MTRPFIDPDYKPPETSARLSYSGNRLDRMSEERDESCIQQALENPQSRAFGMARGRVLVAFENEQPRGLLRMDELSEFSPKLDQAVLLGFDGGAPRLAVPLGINPDDDGFELPDGYKAIEYRSLAAQLLLPHEELGQVAQGRLIWHGTDRRGSAEVAAQKQK